ncbi:MAG: ABC transporter permease [Chryseolinea sp.]
MRKIHGHPPGLALRFFRWYCHPKMQDYIEGDLMEEYGVRLKQVGKRHADLKFIIDVLLLFRPGIIKRSGRYQNANTYDMYKSHLIVALRNIVKQKVYNILNVVGLAVGIGSGLLIAMHIHEELSYEKFIKGYENIYRIHREGWAKSSPLLAEEIKEFIPEIEFIARLSFYGTRVITTDKDNPGEVTGYYADSSVLNVFNLKIIEGDANPLAVANTIVITRKVAIRYFGAKNPIGKILKFDNQTEFPITAVIEDLPQNTHLKFDYLISMPTFYKDVSEDWISRRGWMDMYTYARLKDGTYPKVTERMPQFIRKYYTGHPEIEKMVESKAWQLMALKDIHLHSHLENEMQANGNITDLYIFLVVEILILFVACANFMSLFTTQAIKRVREVGMRKVMGARPRQLMSQFLTEVLLLTFSSLALAIILYYAAIPVYNSLAGRSIEFWDILSSDFMVTLGFIFSFIIIISGLYPATFIANFKAGTFLRESRLPSSMPNKVRNGLVVFQFVVSVSLISGSIFMQQQLSLMKTKDLGFDKDQVINVKLYGYLWWRAYSETEAFKTEFLKSPDILKVGRTGSLIGERLSMETVVPEGKDPDRNGIPTVRVLRIDEDYVDAMDIKIAEGRNFSNKFNDSTSFIINESAARLFNLDAPLNETLDNFTRDHRKGKIVGVVKDYHFASLHEEIEPLIMEYEPGAIGYLTLKIRAGKTTEGLEFVRKTINTLAPNSLFSYEFLDDRLDSIYKAENSVGKILQFFSCLAIIIACLGLLGLSAYTIETRTKEISIRKILGADLAAIVSMISLRFVRLVLVSFFIAVPLTWYMINKWLDNFAYKIGITWWVFFGSGCAVLALAALVTCAHSIKAALANPAHSLRSE